MEKSLLDAFVSGVNNIHSIWSFLTLMILLIPGIFLVRWMFRTLNDIKRDNIAFNGSKIEIHQIKKEVSEVKRDIRTLFDKVNDLQADLNVIKGYMLATKEKK